MVLACTSANDTNSLLVFPVDYGSDNEQNRTMGDISRMMSAAGAKVHTSVTGLVEALKHEMSGDPFLSVHQELYKLSTNVENLLHDRGFMGATSDKEHHAISAWVSNIKEQITRFEDGDMSQNEALSIVSSGKALYGHFLNYREANEGYFEDLDAIEGIQALPADSVGRIFFAKAEEDNLSGVPAELDNLARKREGIAARFQIGKGMRAIASGGSLSIGEYLVKGTAIGEDIDTAVSIGVHVYRADSVIEEISNSHGQAIAPLNDKELGTLLGHMRHSEKRAVSYLEEIIARQDGEAPSKRLEGSVAKGFKPKSQQPA